MPAACFFVELHFVADGVGTDVCRDGGRQAKGGKEGGGAVGVCLADAPQAGGKAAGDDAAHRHAFAVFPALVGGERFERVAEGVAEVEQRALAAFAFVCGDDGGFGRTAAGDHGLQCRRVVRGDGGAVFFEPGEEVGAVDEAVFDDFGHACGEFARRQGSEGGGVDEDGLRLVKRADEVFALRVVHPGFAADGGIDLRQQGGWDLQAGDAALVAGGGEACDVADDAAAESDDEAVAVVTRGDECIEDARPGGQRFVRLAIGQAHGDAGFVGQRRFERREVVRGDGVVRNDADLSLRDDRGEQVAVVQEAVADVDGVAARDAGRQVDGEGVHEGSCGVDVGDIRGEKLSMTILPSDSSGSLIAIIFTIILR